MHICAKVHVKYSDKTNSDIYLFMCATLLGVIMTSLLECTGLNAR